jgi:hypothetical protein
MITQSSSCCPVYSGFIFTQEPLRSSGFHGDSNCLHTMPSSCRTPHNQLNGQTGGANSGPNCLLTKVGATPSSCKTAYNTTVKYRKTHWQASVACFRLLLLLPGLQRSPFIHGDFNCLHTMPSSCRTPHIAHHHVSHHAKRTAIWQSFGVVSDGVFIRPCMVDGYHLLV